MHAHMCTYEHTQHIQHTQHTLHTHTHTYTHSSTCSSEGHGPGVITRGIIGCCWSSCNWTTAKTTPTHCVSVLPLSGMHVWVNGWARCDALDVCIKPNRAHICLVPRLFHNSSFLITCSIPDCWGWYRREVGAQPQEHISPCISGRATGIGQLMVILTSCGHSSRLWLCPPAHTDCLSS